MTLDFDNRTDEDIDISKLEKIASSLTDKDIELIITSNSDIQEINREFRDKDKPTDVLSFPFEEMPGAPLGSIVISIDLVKQMSEKLNNKFEDELCLLFIHGLLHLLGFDHETDSGEHRKKEEELIKEFNLPSSLIIRNDYQTEQP